MEVIFKDGFMVQSAVNHMNSNKGVASIKKMMTVARMPVDEFMFVPAGMSYQILCTAHWEEQLDKKLKKKPNASKMFGTVVSIPLWNAKHVQESMSQAHWLNVRSYFKEFFDAEGSGSSWKAPREWIVQFMDCVDAAYEE